MSYMLETASGEVRAGFVWDNGKIELGDLPPMNTDQSNIYSAQTIASYLPHITEAERNEFIDHFSTRTSMLQGLAVRTQPKACTGAEDESELFSQFIEAETDIDKFFIIEGIMAYISAQSGRVPTYYEANPFEFAEGEVTIGSTYKVTPLEFFFFATQYITGGAWGFYKGVGAPKSAFEASDIIAEALAKSSATFS